MKIPHEKHLRHIFQRCVARITNAHLEFKSHNRNIDTIHRTCVANRFATVTAMMLANACMVQKDVQEMFPDMFRKAYSPICRLSIISRIFQKNGRAHN